MCEGSSPPRSCSSAAVLQGNRIRALLGGSITKFRTDSGSSSGMDPITHPIMGVVKNCYGYTCQVDIFVVGVLSVIDTF